MKTEDLDVKQTASLSLACIFPPYVTMVVVCVDRNFPIYVVDFQRAFLDHDDKARIVQSQVSQDRKKNRIFFLM